MVLNGQGGEGAPEPPGDDGARVIAFPAHRRAGTEAFVTARQLAAHLGMSLSWVEKRTAEGMPSYKFGRARRYRVSEATRWLGARGE